MTWMRTEGNRRERAAIHQDLGAGQLPAGDERQPCRGPETIPGWRPCGRTGAAVVP